MDLTDIKKKMGEVLGRVEVIEQHNENLSAVSVASVADVRR
jgi:hypothetical protein